jgi:hypothetical protein
MRGHITARRTVRYRLAANSSFSPLITYRPATLRTAHISCLAVTCYLLSFTEAETRPAGALYLLIEFLRDRGCCATARHFLSGVNLGVFGRSLTGGSVGVLAFEIV